MFFACVAVVILSLSWVITTLIELPAKRAAASSLAALSASQAASSQADGSVAQTGEAVLGPVQQTDASYTQPSASLVALPEAGRVDMSYFDDALFIGDSLTRGFQEYSSGIPNAKYAAYLGAGPKQFMEGLVENISGQQVAAIDEILAAPPAQPGEVPAPGPALESQPHAPSVTAAVSVQAWNTETPVERTLDADVTASDARLLAVPENGRVSDDYFRDALFIGDSVTQGFAWYPEYRDWMRVCAYKGVNPQSILQNYVGQRADGTKIEMWDEINVQQDVANIYILLGANALLQQTDDGFLKFYGELLDKLRVRFPDTPIYVQSITPTTQEYGEKKPQLEREHLKLINNAIAKLAVSKGLYYVDLWEVMADENGYLRADLAGSDGLHLLDGSKYRPWLDYLAAHTIYSAHNAQFALADGGAYR